MLYKATYFSPVGKITLASDGDNIIGLWLEGQKYYGGTLTEKCITRENIPVFLSAKAWLDKYFAGERPKMSAQAVGGAVGHNPISIIIPCHRVVGTNGSLTGYAGGIDVKIKLLTLEGADMKRLFIPKKGTAL